MSMLDVICKKKVKFFETNSQKCQFDFGMFCTQGQPGLRIRIRDYSRTHFDTANLIAVSNLSNEFPLKITLFEISSIVSICVKFQYFISSAQF